MRVNGTVAKVSAEEHRDHVKPLAGLYDETLIVAGSLRILTFERRDEIGRNNATQPQLSRRGFIAVAAISTVTTLLPGSAIAATPMTELNEQHNTMKKENNMDTITVKDGTQIYYKDWVPVSL